MQLKITSRAILNQIFDLTTQLSDSEYSAKLDLLNGNSIGKHVRHVVEFFELLLEGRAAGVINYDKRNHEILYETNTKATRVKLERLKAGIDKIPSGGEVVLEVSYTYTAEEPVRIKSSFERELAYNIEHAIHHMAIIKIATQTVYPKVQLDENFGVAYSTVRHQKTSTQ